MSPYITGSGCSDKDSRCSGWRSYCRSNQYVKEKCQKTCGTCGGTGGGTGGTGGGKWDALILSFNFCKYEYILDFQCALIQKR